MAGLFRRFRAGTNARPTAAPKTNTTLLSVESLEERAVPAQFFVSNTQDSGAGSLRDALSNAKTNAGPDVITFTSGVTGTINLQSQLLYFAAAGEDIQITGPGANILTINQTKAGARVFDFQGDDGMGGNFLYSVRIEGLTLTGGSPTVGGGGAIRSTGKNLTIGNPTNPALGMQFLNNSAGGNGGAVLHDGRFDAVGSIQVFSSTFANNKATSKGGALHAHNPNNNSRIENSTFSGNTVGGGSGGAIGTAGQFDFAAPPVLVYAGTGLTLRHVTISGNTAGGNNGGGLVAGSGPTGSITVTVINSIVAGNNTGSTRDDIFGNLNMTPATGSSSNLIGSNANNNFFNNVFNNRVGSVGSELDPGLGPLQSNGGSTQTRALLSGSLAIDAVSGNALTVDQRGTARPFGLASDIGAFEATSVNNPNPNPQQPPPTVTAPPGTSVSGSSSSQAQVSAILSNILLFLSGQSASNSGVRLLGVFDFNNDGVGDILLTLGKGKNAVFLVLSGSTGLPVFALPVTQPTRT